MSADWGGALSADRLPLASDDGDDRDRPSTLDFATAPGSWSEDLDTSFIASSSMTLPGQGSGADDCGQWMPMQFCDECGEPHMGQSRCGRRSCPDCGRTVWTAERTEGIVRRLAAARHDADDGLDKRAVHAIASAPEGSVRTLNDVSQGFRDAYQLAREKGVRGGVAIFHGFRQTDEALERFRSENPDYGLWKWIFEQEQDWRELTYWSPHWHIIGLARDVEADDPEAQDGWVFRRIRSLESHDGLRDRESYHDMAGLTRYVLSHATFETESTKDCVRWFGSLATTKFSPDELSDGALSVIDRMVDEIVGSSRDRGDDDPDVDDDDDECCNCGACSMSPIWDAGAALQDKGWCDRIGREQQRRLQAAWEWRLGDNRPPPGLMCPTTEADAREALEAIV